MGASAAGTSHHAFAMIQPRGQINGTGLIIWVRLWLFLARTTTRSKCGLQTKALGGGLHPRRAAVRLTTLKAPPNCSQLRFGLRLVDILRLRRGSRQRPIANGERRLGHAGQSLPQAAPSPALRAAHETGPQRVALDVTHHLIKMLVALDGKRFVPALVQMSVADAAAMLLPSGRDASGSGHDVNLPDTLVASIIRPVPFNCPAILWLRGRPANYPRDRCPRSTA
jgi:hypothetical protein